MHWKLFHFLPFANVVKRKSFPNAILLRHKDFFSPFFSNNEKTFFIYFHFFSLPLKSFFVVVRKTALLKHFVKKWKSTPLPTKLELITWVRNIKKTSLIYLQFSRHRHKNYTIYIPLLVSKRLGYRSLFSRIDEQND